MGSVKQPGATTTDTSSAASPSGRRRRRRSTRLSDTEQLAVGGLAAAAAFAAIVAPAHPLDSAVADPFWSAAFAVLAVVAAARARRWTLVWLTGIATAAAVGSPWVAAAGAGLCLCAIGITATRRWPIVNAAVGGLSALALLHLPDVGFFTLPSIIAAVALAPVCWSAYKYLGPTARRRTRRGAYVAAGVVVLVGVGLAVAARSAQGDLETATDRSREAVSVLGTGDQVQAGQLFRAAADGFRSAHGKLVAPWAWPARLLPGLGPQADALVAASDAGDAVASSAAGTTEAAPYHDLRATSGAIDLGRLEAMAAPLDDSVAVIRRRADELRGVRSEWLVAPVRERLDEFTDALDTTLPDAELAAQTVKALPAMLGADGTRRYFIAFATPSETRFAGGFIGAYGELTATDGKVTLTRSGSIEDLDNAPGAEARTLPSSPLYRDRYARFHPERFLQNLTASPDWPADAAAIAQVYPQAGGAPIDGAIYVDPAGLAAMLQLTGPITVDGLDVPLSADNAADFLLRDQYLTGLPQSERQDHLTAASSATFQALTSRDLPSPASITAALGPAVDGGHLMFTAFDHDANALLERLGTTGRFLDTKDTDYLDARVTNAGGNKIDAFLSRTIDYDATYDPATGTVDATARIELHNAAPADGLPDYVLGNLFGAPRGTNRLALAVFTPNQLEGATLDGRPLAVQAEKEFVGNVYSTLLEIPPGATTVVELKLHGSRPPGAPYHLTLGHQPLATDDQGSVTVRIPGGGTLQSGGLVVDGDHGTWDGRLAAPVTLSLQRP